MGPERTVLAGFSMGAVMSHTMAWSADRPAVAGVLAFSGFVPTVSGWRPSLEDRQATRAFVAHGDRDPVIEVGFGRAARDLLVAGGIDVTYEESDVVHTIDPRRPAASPPTGWRRRSPPRAEAAPQPFGRRAEDPRGAVGARAVRRGWRGGLQVLFEHVAAVAGGVRGAQGDVELPRVFGAFHFGFAELRGQVEDAVVAEVLGRVFERQAALVVFQLEADRDGAGRVGPCSGR